MRVSILVAVGLLPIALSAQPVRVGAPPSSWVPISPSGASRIMPEAPAAPLARRDPGVVTTASLVLPGSGQLLMGQRRWPLYAALEAIGWLVHLDRRRDGRRLREDYRDLAWLTARSASPEPRRDGDWEYFERLEHWTASGRFDADPSQAGVQPETDPRSFNGSVWALARDLYLPDGGDEGSSGYARALDYYEQRAYPSTMYWDWAGKEDGLARYRELIDKSDEQLRTASIVLGAVVANHLFSAADAFVSARIARRSPVSARAGLRAGPDGPFLEWRVELR